MSCLDVQSLVLLLFLAIPPVSSNRFKRSHELPDLGINCDTIEDAFMCADNVNCIPYGWRCNGFLNCPDGSDEQGCPNGMYCDDTARWIPDHWVCNDYSNCADSSDEDNCSCDVDEWQCNNGRCIPLTKYCNKHDDCGDLSDEPPDICICHSTEFTCGSYNNIFEKCIPASSVCDGVEDCNDRLDEYVSRCGMTCAVDEVRCATGVNVHNFLPCIRQSTWCNNYTDCVDLSDESNCTGAGCDDIKCRIYAEEYDAVYSCGSNVDVCDGTEDCTDGIDESAAVCGCGGVECSLTGRCVDSSWYECDGVNDCGDVRDWTDECYCGYGDYQVRFCNNTGRCLAPWQICDGIDDCGDASDENGCGSGGINCDYYSGKDFPCSKSNGPGNSCIEMDSVCNRYSDCIDGSDETFCDDPCGSDETRCATGTSILPGFPICVPNSMWCDNIVHCVDHSDENSVLCQDLCDSHPEVHVQRCPSKANASTYICLDRSTYCDGFRQDCANSEDEGNCCYPGFHRCLDGNSCQESEYFCDGYNDCDDGSDEYCGNCLSYEVACDNRRCINYRYYCDGYDDCYDGSDEPYNCVPVTLPPCDERQFRCYSGECIHRLEVCDGVQHCDGSDEDVSFCGLWWEGLYKTTAQEGLLDDEDKGLTTKTVVIISSVCGAVGLIIILSAVVAVFKKMERPTSGRGRIQTNRNTIHQVGYNARYAAAKQNLPPKTSTFPTASVAPEPITGPQSSTFPTTTEHPIDTTTNNRIPEEASNEDMTTTNAACNTLPPIRGVPSVQPPAPPHEGTAGPIPPPLYSDLYTTRHMEAPQPVLPAPVEP